jgi:hypothetical protein
MAQISRIERHHPSPVRAKEQGVPPFAARDQANEETPWARERLDGAGYAQIAIHIPANPQQKILAEAAQTRGHNEIRNSWNPETKTV